MSTNELNLRNCLSRYGNANFSESEQVAIVLQVLKNEEKNFPMSCEKELLKKAISDVENYKNDNKRHYAKSKITQLIAELEKSSEGRATIKRLEVAGLKKMLFHNSQIKGIELSNDDVLKRLLRYGFIGIGISTLFIALFALTAYIAMPVWLSVIITGLFTGGVTYLSGIMYGVVNDLYATQMNLPYFLLGHQPQQVSLLKTNDPYAQGIAWGVAATFGPVVIAAIIFTIVATIAAALVPLATFTLPVIMVAMPLIAIGAEFYAQHRIKEILKNEKFKSIFFHTNHYQTSGLRFMCPTDIEKAAWFANSDRNMFGFTKVPLIGIAFLVLLVTLSAVSGTLPAILISSAVVTTFIPVGFALVTALSLGAAGCYMHLNKDRQIDDRYKLNWDNDVDINNEFTFDNVDLANHLLSQYQQQNFEIECCQQKNELNITPEFTLLNSLQGARVTQLENPSEINCEDVRTIAYV